MRRIAAPYQRVACPPTTRWCATCLSAASCCLLTLAGLASCTDVTGIRLNLVADSTTCTRAQLLAAIDEISYILESTEDFGGMSNTTMLGDFEVLENGDQPPLLRLSRELANADELPRVRLTPGNNLDRPLTLRVQGLRQKEVWARGWVNETLRFVAGEDLLVDVVLSIDDRWLPPRVLSSVPAADDQYPEGQAPPNLSLHFTKQIDLGTLEENIRLRYLGLDGEQLVPLSLLEQLDTVGPGKPRTAARMAIGCQLSPGRYRIEVSSLVRDLAGAELDQNPVQEGLQAFSSSFTVLGPPAATLCAGESIHCTDNEDCAPYVCQLAKEQTEGICVSPPPTCANLKCTAGYVCKEASLLDAQASGGSASMTGDGAVCVEDCRVRASCPPGSSCTQTTGLCQMHSEDKRCGPHDRPLLETGLVRAFLPTDVPAIVGDALQVQVSETSALPEATCSGDSTAGSPSSKIAYSCAPAGIGPLQLPSRICILEAAYLLEPQLTLEGYDDLAYYFSAKGGNSVAGRDLNAAWTIEPHPQLGELGVCSNLPQPLSCFEGQFREVTLRVPWAQTP